MKKLYAILMLCVGFAIQAGCTKFSDIFDENNENAISPVEVTDTYGQSVDIVTRYDHKELLLSLMEEMGYSPSKSDFAFVVNDGSKLKDVTGKDGAILHWPEIDFDLYTLVVGYFYSPYPYSVSNNQRMVVEGTRNKLYVEVLNRHGMPSIADAGPSISYSCRLYPKLPSRHVKVIRLKNY